MFPGNAVGESCRGRLSLFSLSGVLAVGENDLEILKKMGVFGGGGETRNTKGKYDCHVTVPRNFENVEMLSF